jgi:hypothetical protein
VSDAKQYPGTLCKMWGTLWDVRYSMWDVRYSMWNVRYSMWDVRYSVPWVKNALNLEYDVIHCGRNFASGSKKAAGSICKIAVKTDADVSSETSVTLYRAERDHSSYRAYLTNLMEIGGILLWGLTHRPLQKKTTRGARVKFLLGKRLIASVTCFPFVFYVHVTIHRDKFLYNKTN